MTFPVPERGNKIQNLYDQKSHDHARHAQSPEKKPPRDTDTGGEGAAIGPYTSRPPLTPPCPAAVDHPRPRGRPHGSSACLPTPEDEGKEGGAMTAPSPPRAPHTLGGSPSPGQNRPPRTFPVRAAAPAGSPRASTPPEVRQGGEGGTKPPPPSRKAPTPRRPAAHSHARPRRHDRASSSLCCQPCCRCRCRRPGSPHHHPRPHRSSPALASRASRAPRPPCVLHAGEGIYGRTTGKRVTGRSDGALTDTRGQ